MEYASAKIFKWGMFAFEAFMAIPIIGGAFIVANGWVPLWIALVLHLIGFILSKNAKISAVGHGVGMATSLLGFIPVVGWLFHCITAIILLIEAIKPIQKRYNQDLQ